jgi:hypothetical protein
MSPGRHRHSPPLHKLLPASVVAGVSAICAAGTWFSLEPVVLRGLAAGAAAAAVVGAVVMRSWDRTAGRRVAELERVRQSDAWAHEERVAELEGDLEESREIRTALEGKLRAKRAELAALRNEHAALLRRYATAETERASALEGRRLLAIEAVPARASLPAGPASSWPRQTGPAAMAAPEPGPRTPEGATPWEWSVQSSGAQQGGPQAAGPERVAGPEQTAGPAGTVLTPALFLRASAALDALTSRTGGTERAGRPERPVMHEPAAEPDRHGQGRPGAGQAPSGASRDRVEDGDGDGTSVQRRAAVRGAERVTAPGGDGGVPDADGAGGDGDSHQHADGTSHVPGRRPVAHAAAVVQPAVRVRPTPGGGFDYFGTKTAADAPPATAADPAPTSTGPAVSPLGTVQDEDLADVVGEEALAEVQSATEDQRGIGQVIDLTAHDEPEQLDISQLRNAVS